MTNFRRILLTASTAVFGSLLIVYLVWSFVLWQFDPGLWSEPARAFAAFVSLPTSLGVAAAALSGDAGGVR